MSNLIINLIVFVAIITIIAIPLGKYLSLVYDGRVKFLASVESLSLRLIGVNPTLEMNWKEYALSVLWFSLFSLLGLMLILILQIYLPLNPEHFGAMSIDLAFNTAASFIANTNWQAYGGENTLSYFAQMVGLSVQNFLSAAVGICIALVLIRGFRNNQNTNLGNFWVDLVRTVWYLLIPSALIIAIALLSQGVPQNFNKYTSAKLIDPVSYSQTENNQVKNYTIDEQIIAMGPVASQEAIKLLGTNGGGFYNANSAHPYENPTPLSNYIEMLSIIIIGAALCFCFGYMLGQFQQGFTLYLMMTITFVGLVLALGYFEHLGNPLFANAKFHISQLTNMEGKETRFGINASSLFAAVTTATSCGAVNAMHDSLLPMSGMIPLFLMQLSEIIYGGVGSGLYTILVFAILAVFICGLMIGRTPEYLGKKIESFEMKMVAFIILIVPTVILLGTALSLVTDSGLSSLANPKAHGLTEILYAFTSAANNNGSAFAGLNANTPYYNYLLGIAILIGRFGVIIPVLAIAGNLSMKKIVPTTSGSMPTTGLLFITILIGVVLLVGALTYVPSLALGPVIEHLQLYK